MAHKLWSNIVRIWLWIRLVTGLEYFLVRIHENSIVGAFSPARDKFVFSLDFDPKYFGVMAENGLKSEFVTWMKSPIIEFSQMWTKKDIPTQWQSLNDSSHSQPNAAKKDTSRNITWNISSVIQALNCIPYIVRILELFLEILVTSSSVASKCLPISRGAPVVFSILIQTSSPFFADSTDELFTSIELNVPIHKFS